MVVPETTLAVISINWFLFPIEVATIHETRLSQRSFLVQLITHP